jgi:membrane protein implicated in regulation of membrane protease activity
MLNYIRERQEALGATPGRRIYNYASGAVILAVMALVFANLAPLWIFWIAFPVSIVLDVFLTRKWIRDDALRGYRANHAS